MSEQQVRFPGGGAGSLGDGAGFAAVRARYGADMVIRMQNWPRIAEAYCLAQNGDEVMVTADVAKATADLKRARNDRDFALVQADSIARKMDRDRWTIVPSVAQLRRQWNMDEPIGTVHLTEKPPLKWPSTLPKPPIEVNEADVEARRKAAARAAERIKEAVPSESLSPQDAEPAPEPADVTPPLASPSETLPHEGSAT